MTAKVEVVVAVHDLSRPLHRAVSSVMESSERADALIVAHGLRSHEVAPLLKGLPRERYRIAEYEDGIRSAAGPFNYGIAHAQAEWIMVLGSDDWLEAGAIDALLERQATTGADTIILPLVHQSGERVLAPLLRRRRTNPLDPVRDRMFYRTAPLALVRRKVILREGLVFDDRFVTGDDLEFGARLWVNGGIAAMFRDDPAYIIGADAATRTTLSVVAFSDTLAPVFELLTGRWATSLAAATRRALAIKMLRVHLLGTLARRAESAEPLTAAESDLAAQCVRAAVLLHGNVLAPFSLADRFALERLREGVDDLEFRRLARKHSRRGIIARNLTRNPLRILDRESTVRRYLSYAAT